MSDHDHPEYGSTRKKNSKFKRKAKKEENEKTADAHQETAEPQDVKLYNTEVATLAEEIKKGVSDESHINNVISPETGQVSYS